MPTEEAATLALRTQQVLAHESSVTDAVDPLGGSYFIERLTLDMEQACYKYFEEIDGMGGMVRAIERGFPQREIAQSAYRYQREVESKEKLIVGVNAFCGDQERPPILSIDQCAGARQVEKLRRLRSRRDAGRAQAALDALEAAAQGSDNLMPPILECVRAYCTVGEVSNRLRTVFGVYQETSVI